MRTILMLVVAIAAGCTDEPMDPHVMGPDCASAWGARAAGVAFAACEVGCADGEAIPPLVADGECRGADAWTVQEYDGVLGACLPDQKAGDTRLYFRFFRCDQPEDRPFASPWEHPG